MEYLQMYLFCKELKEIFFFLLAFEKQKKVTTATEFY